MLDRDNSAFRDNRQKIQNVLSAHRDYVAKPTHMSCSDNVFVVKDGWNIYPKRPEIAKPSEVADALAKSVLTHSSLLGESWSLHQVPAGIIVEERISAGGDDATAALEFKTIVIWGKVWASDVRQGTSTIQVLDRDGFGLLDRSVHPSLRHVDWSRVRRLAEKLGAHKDCFRVDIFVSPAPPTDGGAGGGPSLRYLVNEVEFYITSSFPRFHEAAQLWLDGYAKRNYVLIPNTEVSGPYAKMLDPDPREERTFFKELKANLGWVDIFTSSRSHGSRAPRRDALERDRDATRSLREFSNLTSMEL